MIFGGRKWLIYVEGPVEAAGRIRLAGFGVDLRLLCWRVDNPMPDDDVPRGDTNLVALRPRTIDDGEIRLGPVRVEPLTAAQEAQAVELLATLFADAGSRLRRAA